MCSTYNLSTNWQETTLDLPAGVNGTSKRLVFSWVNNASGGTNPPIAIDDIRIVVGSQSDAAVIINNTVSITPPSVTDPNSQVISPQIQISNLTDPADFITVISGYNSLGSGYANAGLDFIFSGADFSGATLNFTHNLGFIPPNLAYKIGDSGMWMVINNPGGWTATTASFSVPVAKGPLDVFLTFSNSGDGTLPITLSLFTATLTHANHVSLYWITATETGVQGYYLYRSEDQVLENASLVSPLIPGTNSSTEQHYQFDDLDTLPATQYYYWLEGLDTDGTTAYYGPVGVLTNIGIDTNPPLVPTRTELIGNFPNPFNPSTTLRYSLKTAAEVNFSIWNCRGQLVNRFSQSHNSPGFFSLIFAGKDLQGRSLASGIYFCRMEAEGQSSIRKMLLLK